VIYLLFKDEEEFPDEKPQEDTPEGWEEDE